MAKCCECQKKTDIVFEARFNGLTTTIYIVKENGAEPVPTGFCKECFKDRVCKDIDHMENQLR